MGIPIVLLNGEENARQGVDKSLPIFQFEINAINTPLKFIYSSITLCVFVLKLC